MEDFMTLLLLLLGLTLLFPLYAFACAFLGLHKSKRLQALAVSIYLSSYLVTFSALIIN
jgi:hypothetical protein